MIDIESIQDWCFTVPNFRDPQFFFLDPLIYRYQQKKLGTNLEWIFFKKILKEAKSKPKNREREIDWSLAEDEDESSEAESEPESDWSDFSEDEDEDEN